MWTERQRKTCNPLCYAGIAWLGTPYKVLGTRGHCERYSNDNSVSYVIRCLKTFCSDSVIPSLWNSGFESFNWDSHTSSQGNQDGGIRGMPDYVLNPNPLLNSMIDTQTNVNFDFAARLCSSQGRRAQTICTNT
jgi:hypothetical protein